MKAQIPATNVPKEKLNSLNFSETVTTNLPSISSILGSDFDEHHDPNSEQPRTDNTTRVSSISRLDSNYRDIFLNTSKSVTPQGQYPTTVKVLGNSREDTSEKERTGSAELTDVETVRAESGSDLLPEIKSRGKMRIEGAHTFQSTQNKKHRRDTSKRDKRARKWTSDEDKFIIFQKETLKKSWKQIEVALGYRHTWQSIQMRYLRFHKTRTQGWSRSDQQRLNNMVNEDFKDRFKRIAQKLGPPFNEAAVRDEIVRAAISSPTDRILKFYSEQLTTDYDPYRDPGTEGVDDEDLDEYDDNEANDNDNQTLEE